MAVAAQPLGLAAATSYGYRGTAVDTSGNESPATAAKAMSTLVDEGLLHKRRGLGMFVSEGARELLRQQRRATFWDDTLGPVLDEARALGITTDQLIDHLLAVHADAAQHRDYIRGIASGIGNPVEASLESMDFGPEEALSGAPEAETAELSKFD